MKEKFWKFIDKNLFLIFFIIITIFGIAIRSCFMDFESGDYLSFLQEWFSELKEGGGLLAIKNYRGDYNAPYITIMALLTYLPLSPLHSIKIVSIIFDYILAMSSMVLIYKLFKNNRKKDIYALITYAAVLLLPTVILNSSAWAQCDSIYVAFAVISLIYLIDEKYIKSFIFLGISFAFKLQFIFLLPVYVLVYITKRKFPIYYFFILPITNLVLCLPAIIFGKSLLSCMAVYGNQMEIYKQYISLNFPGVYNLFLDGNNLIYFEADFLSKAGVIFTVAIFAIIALIFLYKKVELEKQDIISISLWSVMIATFFLPHMHDRYMFAADILSIIYFIYNRKKWYIPVGVNFVSLYTYFAFLWGSATIDITYVSIFNLVLLAIVTKDIYEKLIAERR